MHPPSVPLGRRLIDGTVWGFLADALLFPAGLLIAVFLTRRLGAESYGLYTLAATLVGWIEWALPALFARAAVKLIGEADDWRPVGITVTRLYLLASGGAALVLAAFAEPVAAALHEPVLAPCLRLFALDLPLFGLAQAHRNILIGVGGYRQQALATAGRWLARPLLIVALVQAGLGLWGAVFGCVGASLVELLVGRCYVRPPLLGRSNFPARVVWEYASPLLLFGLSLHLFQKTDLVALKLLGASAAQVGAYGAAQNLALVPTLFGAAFSPLLLSALSRLRHGGDEGQARRLARDAMRLVLGLLPFAALAAGAAPEIIDLLFGPDFAAAAGPLGLLLFAALALMMLAVAAAVLIALGKPGWTAALAGPLLPLAAVGHLVLIPALGAVGAAWVTTLLAFGAALAGLVAVDAAWSVRPPARTFAHSLLVGVLVYGLATLWPAPGPWVVAKLLAAGLLVGSLYLALGEFGARAPAASLRRRQAVPQ